MNKIIRRHPFKIIVLMLLAGFITGCGTNPVTGKSELQFVSERQEVDIGKENYIPSQQSQGGTYTVDKALSNYVNAVGQKLAKVSDRPNLPYEFVVLNNSVPNAWALPGGKIAINRGLLLHLNNEAELAAVISHEIVHAAARHGAKSMERGMLLNVGIVGLGVAAGDTDNAELIVGAAALGSQLISQKYGRDAELEADQYGIKYMVKAGYDPAAAIKLQETFVALSNNKKSNWLDGLFASHPPSQERVDANKKTAAKFKAKGVLNGENYQKQIAHLKKTKPAYDKYDQAKVALKELNSNKAIKLVDEAIALESKEGLFYALKGDIAYGKEQYQDAETAFSKAIQLNPDFFLFYLERGMTHEKLKNPIKAKQDLKKSIDLLPTAPAYYSLGNIAVEEKNVSDAKSFYKQAASSKSEIGKKSAAAYTRLDLPANPTNYFTFQGKADRNGKIIVTVKNRSVVPVKNLSLELSLFGEKEKLAFQKSYQFPRVLRPGDHITIDTGVDATALGKAAKINANITRVDLTE